MSTKPSSYLLILENQKEQERRVGCLGRVRFAAGSYIYVGSGGPNVTKRVRRHLAPRRRRHWHIDLLATGRQRMRPVDARVYPGVAECWLAARLARDVAPVPRFGASDCTCPTHLFFEPDLSALSMVLTRFGNSLPAQPT